MGFPDRRTLNVLMTTLLFTLVLAIVYVARVVIVIFAFSILFAYLINPIVRFLQSHSLFFKNLAQIFPNGTGERE
jgi:predicted PurR-regulated permease PerM